MAIVMQRIEELTRSSVTPKPRIALDTCCVQYYLSDPPVQPWADCLDPIFHAGLKGNVELYVSTVVVSELLAHVHFSSRNKAGYDPELDLLAILNRHFQILDVNNEIAKAAGRLRGTYIPDDRITLKTPDALIAATSLADGHTLFVTNDAELASALPATNCIYLRDLALEWLGQGFPRGCVASKGPITPLKRGIGLSPNASLVSLELGSIRPDPSAKWNRILADASSIAIAVNEPCFFFILMVRNGQKIETHEVLFWHDGMENSRPSKRILKRLQDHLELKYDRDGYKANPSKSIYIFCFISLSRERARQSQTRFASKSNHQREADAWSDYLLSLWRFRKALQLPQTKWLLCEDGMTQLLDLVAAEQFLDQAKNVLGWKDKQ